VFCFGNLFDLLSDGGRHRKPNNFGSTSPHTAS
jgi:hypothetical protein